MTLPAHATEASHQRYQLALQLAQSCPPELGEEIALTGSTARGWADDDSDLELNLWSETIPPTEARVTWLEAAGVEHIEVFDQPRSDDSYWISGRIGSVPIEVGWQTYAAYEGIIKQIVDGSRSGTLPYIILNAIPLRTSGKLGHWQAQLRGYSEVVQRQILEAVVKRWANPDYFKDWFRLLKRGERLYFTQQLLNDLNAMISLLYAINQRWQPSGKWTLTAARELPLMPERWHERIDTILTAPPEEGVHLCLELLLDALALVPPQYDVSAAVTTLQEAEQLAKRRSF